MARHTKVYNALLSFYVGSIDEILTTLCLAHDKRFSDQPHLEELKKSYGSEIIAILELAKDQSLHFCKHSEMIGDWEKESLVNEVATYANRSTGKLKSSGVLSKTYLSVW